MSDYVEVINEIKRVNTRLSNAIIELNRLAKEKAQAEKNYTLAMFSNTLELKEAGTSITLVPLLAKGKSADELYLRDLYTDQFTAVRDSISALQTQATMLQSILKIQKEIEWSA